MGNLRPWFADDIARVIKSVLFTTLASQNEDYRRGFLACAISICMAIGIDVNDVKADLEAFYEASKKR